MSESPKRFTYRHRVRFVDTDASGRIHYTAMMRFFEAAEFEFMRFIGSPYEHIELRLESYPRVHVEADYLCAILYEDVIDVEVSLDRVGEKSYTLRFDVTKGGATVGKGKIVVACMDKATQQSRPLPAPLSAKLKEYLRA